MKIFLLEPDSELADRIDTSLNQLRLKIDVKKVQHEEDLFHEDPSVLPSYNLFILNLKDPTDACTIKFLRENGSDAPVLLVLEANPNPDIFQILYYLSYESVIVKDFLPAEIIFSIYKLCDIWNDDRFFLSKDIYFDFQHCKFVNHDAEVILGKKEALLMKLFSIKSPHVTSFNDIACYVYQGEIASEERIRSLVRQLRSKIPFDFIETHKGEGYKIANKRQEESQEVSPTLSLNAALLFLSAQYPMYPLLELL